MSLLTVFATDEQEVMASVGREEEVGGGGGGGKGNEQRCE